MQFSELSLGDVVEVKTSNNHSDRATVIGLYSRESAGGHDVLVGWPDQEHMFNNGYSAIVAPGDRKVSYVSNVAVSFPYRAWIFHEHIISKMITTPSAPAVIKYGFACTRCRAYNEYAIANQSDGTFVCYGCRGH